MKKFLQIFFMTLGVVFFILIVVGIYLYVADPFQIKPIIKSFTEQPVTEQTSKVNSPVVDKNQILTPSQEQMLQKIGVDPATLPTTISPVMEQCFYDKLGKKRAEEIKAGAQPTATDFFMARSCIK